MPDDTAPAPTSSPLSDDVLAALSLISYLQDIERGATTVFTRGNDLPVDVRERALQLIIVRALTGASLVRHGLR